VPCAQGIFETLAVINGRPRLLQRHLKRLFDGCIRLGMRAPVEAELVAEIAAQAALPGTGVVKIIVPGGDSADRDSAQRLVRAEPPRQRPPAWVSEGVAIITCRTRLALQPELAGLKLLDRSAQALARREWTADSIAEGLMLDQDGRLISGTMTNVYAVIDGAVCTPALTRCGVAGVMRAELLEAWQSSGQASIVRDLDPAELAAASELFVSNALIGVWPVRRLDRYAFHVGPVARAAATWVQRIVKEPSAPLGGGTDLRFPPS
jgi:4-amino-4-deoxychorismate lyase